MGRRCDAGFKADPTCVRTGGGRGDKQRRLLAVTTSGAHAVPLPGAHDLTRLGGGRRGGEEERRKGAGAPVKASTQQKAAAKRSRRHESPKVYMYGRSPAWELQSTYRVLW